MKMLAKARNAITAMGRVLQLNTPVVERDDNSRLDRRSTDVVRSWSARIGVCAATSSMISLLLSL
jgi:hypothetical protein